MKSILARLIRPLLSKSDHDRIFSKPLDRERRSLIFKAGISRLFGRPVKCHLCGKELGRVITRTSGGNIEVWGLHEGAVRVSFNDRVSLRFAHVHAEECPALQQKQQP